MEELVGKRCTIVDENSFFKGDCGVIDFFDGELYHVMIDGDLDTFAFEREALCVLDDIEESQTTEAVNFTHVTLTKEELIKAINQSFPDVAAPIAAVTTIQLPDGSVQQNLTFTVPLSING